MSLLAVLVLSVAVPGNQRPLLARLYLHGSECGEYKIKFFRTPYENVAITEEIEGSGIREREAHKVMSLICQGFSLYPRSCFEKIGIDRVVISSHLFLNGKSKAAATVDHMVVVDGYWNATRSSDNIHCLLDHELFHVFDRYNSRSTEPWPLSDKREDFIAEGAYREHSIPEDRAETFATVNCGFVPKDSSDIIRQKIEIVLRDFRDFCPIYQPPATKIDSAGVAGENQ
jgi:hypothetical protein